MITKANKHEYYYKGLHDIVGKRNKPIASSTKINPPILQ